MLKNKHFSDPSNDIRNSRGRIIEKRMDTIASKPISQEDFLGSMEDAERKIFQHHLEQESVSTGFPYLVRGAVLRCEYGSHQRKLNLPICHGVYTSTMHPLVHEMDCVVGDHANISTYGICSSPQNTQKGAKVTLISENGANITGRPCTPVIVGGKWLNGHPHTKIAKNRSNAKGSNPRSRTYYSALTTDSFLLCACRGLIKPMTSGQENTESVKTELRNPFPVVVDNNGNPAYGGNQTWFQHDIQKEGGCGPVAATNILAHMALSDPAIAAAFGLDPDPTVFLTQNAYKDFMDNVYQTVRPYEIEEIIDRLRERFPNSFRYIENKTKVPTTIGLWPISPMAEKTVEFAAQHGVILDYTTLTNGDIRNGSYKFESIGYSQGMIFIQNAIYNDQPVALLNTFNKTEMINTVTQSSIDTQLHWVTITGYEKNENDMILTISSWGNEYTMSYKALYESWRSPLAAGSGLICFEVVQ